MPEDAEDGITLLTEPRDGLPPVVDTPTALAAAIERLAGGTGPVAVDAERASGYRYGQRAYLVQLRRAGSGTVLVDPDPLRDLSALGDALAPCEWILHAASQDLACLAEVGMVPRELFDTELAARLAGYERVGLAALTEGLLGLRLEKGHSAADWSTRPLPEPWLRYAALDVELLIPLRERLDADLVEQGKREWAAQEFAAVLAARPAAPRADPWRRTSGIHRVRSPRQIAAVRALWEARDELARARDVAPGRVLPDSSIIAAATSAPADRAALAALPVFGGPRMRRHLDRWWAALTAAAALPDSELPPVVSAGDGPPPVARWPDRDPAAAARLARMREALGALATAHRLPVENLLEPALARRVAWSPPEPPTAAAIAAVLASGGARPWQVEVCLPALVDALTLAADPGPVDPGPVDPGPVDPGPVDPGPVDPTPEPGDRAGVTTPFAEDSPVRSGLTGPPGG